VLNSWGLPPGLAPVSKDLPFPEVNRLPVGILSKIRPACWAVR